MKYRLVAVWKWFSTSISCRQKFSPSIPTKNKTLLSHFREHATTSFLTYWNKVAVSVATQIAKSMGRTWGPPGSCRPQMGPMLAPWTLLPGYSWLNHGKLASGCLAACHDSLLSDPHHDGSWVEFYQTSLSEEWRQHNCYIIHKFRMIFLMRIWMMLHNEMFTVHDLQWEH